MSSAKKSMSIWDERCCSQLDDKLPLKQIAVCSLPQHQLFHQTHYFGAPQGSILGPLLSPVRVNDAANVSLSLIAFLFADDTNILPEGIDVNEVTVEMITEMARVMDDINADKLSLNKGMTACAPFHTKAKDFSSPVHVTKCNNKIHRVNHVNF